jgi:hypothetical protein
LAHYVERHAVMLPDEFVASASARGWEVPPRDQVPQRGEAAHDYSFWLQWAKGLPDVPAVQAPPDPQVLERFCLIIQDSEADGPDEQMDAFEETVWDGLRRYRLMDRVKVICTEPDPDNWQRNRDVTVWPQGDATELTAAADGPTECHRTRPH